MKLKTALSILVLMFVLAAMIIIILWDIEADLLPLSVPALILMYVFALFGTLFTVMVRY